MRPRNSATELALLALATMTLSGCFVVRASGRAVSSLFSSPRAVVKTHQPVTKDARLAAVWVGHSTVLIQIDDKVVLTDPVFTSSVGQFSKRLVEPGLDPKDLPPVDAVLISHMHIDHLSLGSLDLIESKVKTALLPTTGTAYLTGGFSFPAYELRTWQSWEKDGLRVTAVPVDHIGGRYGIDETWLPDSYTGYVIEYHGLKVYFGGDSAYDQRNFVETAGRFPKIDLALIPIAPIGPRSVMRNIHMDPSEAVQAFVDLDAKRMIPIHYGTFVTSTDEPGEPLRDLAAAQKKVDLGARVIAPLAIGERRVFLKEGEGPEVPALKPFPPPATTPAPEPTPAMPDDDKFE